MTDKSSASELAVEFASGGSLARRRAQLLNDGAYLFEDELQIDGVVTATIITCLAWLVEFYELRTGHLVFISGDKWIRPSTRHFGVLYPPFTITQPRFESAAGHVLGIAATAELPQEFTTVPIIFETSFDPNVASLAAAVARLKQSTQRQPVPINPNPSLLSIKAKRSIDKTYLDQPSIAGIASQLGVSHEHLSRQFRRDFQMSPSAYLRKLRVADATLMLARGEDIISISQDVGYKDLSRFYKQFRKTTDTSPGACRTILKP